MWWFNDVPSTSTIWQVPWAENPVDNSKLSTHNQAMKALEINEDEYWDEPYIWEWCPWLNIEC
jgi:hypothetical protein